MPPIISNHDDIFLLGLKLNVGLITLKEIQVWASEKILQDNTDELILDLCFLKNERDIKDYFDTLIRKDLMIQNQSIISMTILKEYILQRVPSDLEDDIFQYIADVELIVSNIRNADLISLLCTYSSQVELASLGYLHMTVKHAFDMFLHNLNVWLVAHSNEYSVIF